jgi:purine-cytosine permease-like protein
MNPFNFKWHPSTGIPVTAYLTRLQVGYCTIDAIIGGQMLSAVNGGGMSIVVGIIVVQIISWIVAVFGMKFFHVYER